MVETQRHAERDAVLRRHQIFRLVNGVMSDQFFDSTNGNLPNVPRIEAILLRELFQPFDGRMSIDVTGVPFDADIERLELPSQAVRQPGKVGRVGKGPANPNSPSRTLSGPANPRRANDAAVTPPSAAFPRWRRLIIAPS